MNNALIDSYDVRVGIAPCKGCPDRPDGGGCHSTCERFITWKANRDRIKQADFEYEWHEGRVNRYFIDQTESRRKRYKGK